MIIPLGHTTPDKPEEQKGQQKVIDEGFNESLSSEAASDESFLYHMKRIVGHVSSDEDSSSQTVETDPEFMDEKERSIRNFAHDKDNQEEEQKLVEASKEHRSELTSCIQDHFKAQRELYKNYKYKKLLDRLI